MIGVGVDEFDVDVSIVGIVRYLFEIRRGKM